MSGKRVSRKFTLLAGMLASSVLLASATQAADRIVDRSPAAIATAQQAWVRRHGDYFKRTWGIDIAGVRWISSGYMLEFRYRVLDPNKAKPLNDRSNRPYLKDLASGVTLSVPALEKVGEIRQSVPPKPNHIYFMVFGNPGKIVQPGNRVSIAVGKFHVDDLVVQ
ncbi:MAG: hypothetical protein GC149_17600 [Gammaproteobacteria bacterium]|nr:hypothetical protein [Gammaproteobacteria bacterium]